jgi:hypothetical protein
VIPEGKLPSEIFATIGEFRNVDDEEDVELGVVLGEPVVEWQFVGFPAVKLMSFRKKK